MEICQKTTKGEKEKLESEYGTRLSNLIMLPYYDSVRYAIIDPMHNLFLGTSKKMINVWKEKKYLTEKTLSLIQQRVDKAHVPSDVGKLPGKIEKFTFDGFTADELKNWTILFSIYALKGIIPDAHLENWRYFVLATTYLANQMITESDLKIADDYLIKFCKGCESLYGKDVITPNMHLHCHLMNCTLDYGPIYSFWCFSFERYNGLLGNYPTNKRDIEIQLMKRFYRDSNVISQSFPEQHKDEFVDIFALMDNSLSQRGALNEITTKNLLSYRTFSSKFHNFVNMKWFDLSGIRTTGRKLQEHELSDLHHDWLKQVYSTIYTKEDGQQWFIPKSGFKTSEVYR